MNNPLLTDIVTGDTDLQRWQKLNAWATLLAQNVSGGGGGGGGPNILQASIGAVTTGLSSINVNFSSPFGLVPAVICQLVPPNGGAPILCDATNITINGFTANWGFAVPAGYNLSWHALKPTE